MTQRTVYQFHQDHELVGEEPFTGAELGIDYPFAGLWPALRGEPRHTFNVKESYNERDVPEALTDDAGELTPDAQATAQEVLDHFLVDRYGMDPAFVDSHVYLDISNDGTYPAMEATMFYPAGAGTVDEMMTHYGRPFFEAAYHLLAPGDQDHPNLWDKTVTRLRSR